MDGGKYVERFLTMVRWKFILTTNCGYDGRFLPTSIRRRWGW